MRMERRFDPHHGLLRRLQRHFEQNDAAPVLCASRSERWVSATFTGARHVFAFALEAADAAWLERLRATLDVAEFDMPGHIVADIAIPIDDDRQPPARFTIEALTVEAD